MSRIFLPLILVAFLPSQLPGMIQRESVATLKVKNALPKKHNSPENTFLIDELTDLDDRALSDKTKQFIEPNPGTVSQWSQTQAGLITESVVNPVSERGLSAKKGLSATSSYFLQSIPPEFELNHLRTPVPKLILPSAFATSQSLELIEHARQRAQAQEPSNDNVMVPSTRLPDGFQPWWSDSIRRSIGIQKNGLSLELDTLIQAALQYSPHVQLAATEPHIRQSVVFEEAARFDWQSFLESKYTDTNDPIGNSLTTGNNESRFREQEYFSRSGLRRRNRFGGETELTQRLGYLDNNSRFITPANQGNSRLELNYRHPLLRGGGSVVNESLILLADIDYQISSDTFFEELQAHLVDVAETYWELVRARSEYLQRKKVLESGELILSNLEGRAEVDVLKRQVNRARAAVANRRAQIIRSLTSIKNAEARLKLLVNEPSLLQSSNLEFAPSDPPGSDYLPMHTPDVISSALANRPDVSRALREFTATTVQQGIAANEVLPKLDLLLGSYVAGLDGDSDILNSWVNQFRDGRPGFNVGFEFEIPLGNRAALARQQKREWEVTRATHKFRAVVETSMTEVEIAIREVKTAYQEMVGRYHSMVAANNEQAYLLDRWRTLPELNDSVTLLLENVLDSQDRVADEEASFAKAQFDFSVATIRLKQATGTLFIVNH